MPFREMDVNLEWARHHKQQAVDMVDVIHHGHERQTPWGSGIEGEMGSEYLSSENPK